MTVKKIPTTNKYIIGVSAASLVVIGLIAAAFLIRGKIVDSTLLMRQQIDKINTKRLTLENLRTDLALAKQIKEQISGYDSYIFPQGEELNLITDLENIAANNHVAQKIIGSNLDNYTNGKILITLNIGGSYVDVLKYIADLENYKYFVAIQHIVFENAAGPNDATGSKASAQIQISLYADSK